MLKYFLEFEEAIGKNWDSFLTKKVKKSYEDEIIYFNDISKHLIIFYHLLGGDQAKELKITDKRYVNRDKTFLEKISFFSNEFFLPWQDDNSLYLPASFSYFPSKRENELYYYWIVAMLSKVNITTSNFEKENLRVQNILLNRYEGFKLFYENIDIDLENLNQPNPLWIYPSLNSNNKATHSDDEDMIQSNQNKNKTDELKMKKKANQIDDTKDTNGFLVFLPESLMSIFEQVNVDRMEDDSFDEDALYHAEDLDEITVGKKLANLSARVKMDLDLQPDTTEIYPLGIGHLIDEWDYRKKSYLKNYVRIKPQVTVNIVPTELPQRLKRMVKKIQAELDLLEINRIKNDRLPYGDELNIDTWIDYKGHQNRSTHHQNFYTSYEKKTRDMATLILADVSLSTEGGITQDVRIIDVIKDGLMVFSEALEKLNDKFAIYSFSSLQNKKVYFNIIKNFKDKYNDLIRGRIDSMQPYYYTRLGAAIRESTKILDKQQSSNKLLLIISDGKPNDEDRYDGRYGIEDTKKAIEEARKKGIVLFCITIDLDAKEYLNYLFGRNGYAIVRDGQNLPKVIPEVYINLTK